MNIFSMYYGKIRHSSNVKCQEMNPEFILIDSLLPADTD